jgi:NitT/TauT family transport system ATP-binding protein
LVDLGPGDSAAAARRSPQDPAYIDVRSVTKRFGGATAQDVLVLDNISLSIPRAKFASFIGPSGCGKSTLLRIVNGLIPADSGEVRINGKSVTGPDFDRAMVFQTFNLFEWRTALQNVTFGLELRGVGREQRERRARELLAQVGLEGFERHYPAQLSGGMQQRVGLARALAVDPAILLMDEPFGSVDAQTRMVLQGDFAELVGRLEMTVIFVTHDMEEAVFMADQVFVMGRRPSKIAEVIDVPFPRPRSEALRSDPEFVALKDHIWEILWAAKAGRDDLSLPVPSNAPAPPDAIARAGP